VHRRSGIARKPVVPPAGPSGRQSMSHRLSASAHKDRTWPAAKQFLRRQSSPLASALSPLRANCRLGSTSPQRLVIVPHCDCVALQVPVLSAFPTSATSFFSQCPISGPSSPICSGLRRRRFGTVFGGRSKESDGTPVSDRSHERKLLHPSSFLAARDDPTRSVPVSRNSER